MKIINYFKNNKYLLNGCILLSFVFLSVLSFFLLLKYHFVVNMADTQFHFKRINELAEDIKFHNFLPEFSFNQFHGSAVMLLYPYLNLYPFALLSFVVHSKILLFYGYLIFILFMGLIISYYSSFNFTKNSRLSYLFSIIYMISSTFMGYCLSLTDFGAISAYIFWPMIIFGFLKFLNNSFNYLELSFGFIFMFFSHIPSLVISILLILIWSLLNARKLISKKFIFNGTKIIIIVGLFTSIIWIPVANFLIFNKQIIHFTNPVIPSGVGPGTFIRSSLGNFDSLGLGFIVSISVIVSIFFYKKFNRYTKQMYWISIFVILLSSSLVRLLPMSLLKILESFQFLYRFLIIPIILLCYILSVIITKYISNRRFIYFLTIMLVIFIQLGGQMWFVNKYEHIPVQSKYNDLYYKMYNNNDIDKLINKQPDGTNSYGVVTDSSTGSDYYPKTSFTKLNYINNGCFMMNHLSKYKKIHKNGYNKFIIYNNNSNNKIVLPFLKYKNEKLKLYDNNKLKSFYVNKNNMIELYKIDTGVNKFYIKRYSNQYLMKLSFVMILLGILLVSYHFYKENKKEGHFIVR